MSESSQVSAQEAWREFAEAEQNYYRTRIQAVNALKDNPGAAVAIMRTTLLTPGGNWGAALRLLPLLDESVRQLVFSPVIDLAAHDTNFVFDARAVVMSMDEEWLDSHLPDEIDRILSASPDLDSYRRLAELLAMLHSSHLRALLARAQMSSDRDIREIAEDFDESEHLDAR